MSGEQFCYKCGIPIEKGITKCKNCGAPIIVLKAKLPEANGKQVKIDKRKEKEDFSSISDNINTLSSEIGYLSSLETIKKGLNLFIQNGLLFFVVFLALGLLGSLFSQALAVFVLNPVSQYWADAILLDSVLSLSDPLDLIGIIIVLGLTFPDLIITVVFTSISSAFVILYNQQLLSKENNKEIFSKILPAILPLVFGGLIIRLLVVIGTLLFIIPGVLIAVWFSLYVPVLLLEKKNSLDSLRTSFSLTNVKFLKALVIQLFFLLINFFVNIETTALVSSILFGVPNFEFLFFKIELIGFLLGGIIAPLQYSILLILYLTLLNQKIKGNQDNIQETA